ncbi:MAG: winged helix-turn-helix domain-containing protein [Lachnospiraceae bacterium]|nr:winged helix-turn-helix domain-containing protein [Lachnospiraceae bacterium]
MIEVGKTITLNVKRMSPQGAYLSDGESDVLLPARQVPDDTQTGDALTVFIYRDSKDRIISTVRVPFIRLGEIARLKVKEMTKIGAFLDMGLERDLLLPFHEMTSGPSSGKEVLVAMYLDKSGRLCATEKIYKYLESNAPYKKDDEVSGTLYEISRNFGAFVAVDDRYSALIPAREFSGGAEPGDTIVCRVTGVKPDGRLDLSMRKKAYLQMGDDAGTVLDLIMSDGSLPFTDKASPELIKEKTGLSKAAFKRAVGHLLKEKKIVIKEDGIYESDTD